MHMLRLQKLPYLLVAICVVLGGLLGGQLLASNFGQKADANMPAYGPVRMTGKVGNALLWQMKRNARNFRGHAFRMALAQRGDRYVWGAAGPNAFDCSGLIVYSYRLAGRHLPHSSYSLRQVTRSIPLSQARAGDLLLYSGHVEMYAGTYKGVRYAVAAHRPGVPVDLTPMRYRGLLKVGRVR